MQQEYPVKGTPKTHQARALAAAKDKAGFCWWMDPGAGKTYVTIADAGRLYQQGEITGAIICAPLGPHAQWIEEQIPLWLDVRHATADARMTPAQWKKFIGTKPRCMEWLAVNYDMLRTKGGRERLDQFIERHPEFMLVLDESQKIKNPRAQRTKEALALSLKAAYTRLLSGTPILKGLEDLWTQYEACEAGLAWPHEPIGYTRTGKLHTYGYIGYRNHYCQLAPIPGQPRAARIVGYRNEDQLRDRVRDNVARVPASEFMKADSADFMIVRCEMNKDQKRHYLTMREHLVAMMDGETISVTNALTQMQKLSQIASGYIMTEDGGYEQVGDSKLRAMIDLVEQLDEPVLIWSPYIPLKEMAHHALIEEGYGDRVVLYQSDSDCVERWKQTPNGIMLGNPASGMGVGLNLQHAAANIYLANNFSSEARWQSLKRTDRIGQERQVRNWDLVAPDTVDVTALRSLQSKEEISRRNIDELRSLI